MGPSTLLPLRGSRRTMSGSVLRLSSVRLFRVCSPFLLPCSPLVFSPLLHSPSLCSLRSSAGGVERYEEGDCDYWYQIGLVLSQLDGMVAGYNEHCAVDKVYM